MPQYAPVIDVNGLPRTFPQTDCQIEPGFAAEDNATFYASAPDYLSHAPKPECPYSQLPHKVTECPWFQNISTDERPGCEECTAEFDEVMAGVLFDCLGCNAKLCILCHYSHFIAHGLEPYEDDDSLDS